MKGQNSYTVIVKVDLPYDSIKTEVEFVIDDTELKNEFENIDNFISEMSSRIVNVTSSRLSMNGYAKAIATAIPYCKKVTVINPYGDRVVYE
ncbi:MAG: hypothetical protein DRP09_18085 [Candidatus Thorarchaeota archaeon]|nr:MAG: hypothetical protein DRP09_18085 [Candidatus Thorarchaeota archaeon]